MEVPLDGLLHPGRYSVRMSLADAASGVQASVESLALDVEAPDAEDMVGRAQLDPGGVRVDQRTDSGGTPGWLPVPGAFAAVALAAGLILAGRRRAKASRYKHVAGRSDRNGR